MHFSLNTTKYFRRFYQPSFLLIVGLLAIGCSLNGQTMIGTVASGENPVGIATLNGYTIPAGDNRALIVCGFSFSGPSVATYDNGTGAVNIPVIESNRFLGASPDCACHLLAIGTGTTEIGDISWDGEGTFSVIAFENVDQSAPTISTNSITGGPNAYSLPLTTTPGATLLDFAILARTGSLTEGAGQTIVGSGTNGMGAPHQWTTKQAASTSESMAQTSNENIKYFGMALNPVLLVAPASPIPTMGEWGLLIFGLLVLNFGVLFIRKKQALLE